MKTLLSLLLLIPSLSWGDYLNPKEVPTTKKELNFLFGHTIGETFEMSLLTESGMKAIQKPLENEKYPYIWIYRDTKEEDKPYYAFEGEIFNEEFDNFAVALNSNQVISGLHLSKNIDTEKLTSCEDFSIRFLKAYKFKREINDEFLDYYFYTTTKGTDYIENFISKSILRDKEGRVAETECVNYFSSKDREILYYFGFTIHSPELFEARGLDNLFKDWYDKFDFYELNKEEFEKFFKLHSEFDTTGL